MTAITIWQLKKSKQALSETRVSIDFRVILVPYIDIYIVHSVIVCKSRIGFAAHV